MLNSPYFYLIAAPVLWSGNFIISKGVLVNELPPVTITAARFTIAALGLWVLITASRKRGSRGVGESEGLGLLRKDLPAFIILALTGIFGFNTFVYLAFRYTTAINASLVTGMTPVLTALLSWMILRETMNLRQVSGICLSLGGVVWIITRGSWEVLTALRFNPGDLIMLLAALSWAIYSTLGKKVMTKYPPLTATYHAVWLGLLFLWPVALIELRQNPVTSVSVMAVLGVFYVGIGATILAYLAWNKGVAMIGAGRSGVFQNLLPVFTAVLATVFLSEPVTLSHIIGGTAVLLGVYFTSYVKPASGNLQRPLEQARRLATQPPARR